MKEFFVICYIRTAMLMVLMFGCSGTTSDREWNFEHITLKPFLPIGDMHSGECAIVDIDNDGRPDVWFSADGGEPDIYSMGWYRNPDWDLFRLAQGDYVGGNWMDVDGDGDQDLVSGKEYGSLVYVWIENPGNPEQQKDWAQHVIHEGVINSDMTHFADINNDGRKDIVVTSFRRDVHYIPRPADPFTSPWKIYNVGHSDHPRTGGSVGDVDNDGDIDIVWGNGWLENTGQPNRESWRDHIIDPGWNHDAQSAVVDLDGDGTNEVVLAGEESFDGLAWYSWDAAGGSWIKHPVAGQRYSGLHSLQTADFDQDGDLDLFTAEMHQSGYIDQVPPHQITVFENVNISRNQWNEHVVDSTGSHNARIGDVNGDGYPDIVGSNWNNRLEEYPLEPELWINQLPE